MEVRHGNLGSSTQIYSVGVRTPVFQKLKELILSGFSLAVLANLLWGTSFLASKATLNVWAPFTASSLRFLLALAVMGIAFPRWGYRLKLPKSLDAWTTVLVIGVTGFGLLYPLQLSGLNHISSGLSASIMLTSPLFVALLAAVFLRENFSSTKLIAIGFGIAGGLLLLSPAKPNALLIHSGEVFTGSMLTLAASFCLAASVIATRKASNELDPANLTFWSMAVGLLVLLPFAAFENAELHRPALDSPVFAKAVLSLFYLAVICSAFCFLIWNQAISKTPAKELASTMHIKTPAAVLLGCSIAHEAFPASAITGTTLVAVGVLLSQLGANLISKRRKGRAT